MTRSGPWFAGAPVVLPPRSAAIIDSQSVKTTEKGGPEAMTRGRK